MTVANYNTPADFAGAAHQLSFNIAIGVGLGISVTWDKAGHQSCSIGLKALAIGISGAYTDKVVTTHADIIASRDY